MCFSRIKEKFACIDHAVEHGLPPFDSVAREPANKLPGVYPYPHNVVRTNSGAYVNASYITADIIAAQYPTHNYYDRWWTALCQAGSKLILMLCESDEEAIQPLYFGARCADTVCWKQLSVKTCSVTLYPEYGTIVRQLLLTWRSDKTCYTLLHIHYKHWKDGQLPPNNRSFQWLKCLVHSLGLPFTVHCRAGIGRTGTFLASYLRNYGCACTPTVYDIVCFLRQRRPLCVHNERQYNFLVEESVKGVYMPPQRYIRFAMSDCAVFSVQFYSKGTQQNTVWKLSPEGGIIVIGKTQPAQLLHWLYEHMDRQRLRVITKNVV